MARQWSIRGGRRWSHGEGRTSASHHLMLRPFSAYGTHADDPGRAMCVLGDRMSEYTGLARELSALSSTPGNDTPLVSLVTGGKQNYG